MADEKITITDLRKAISKQMSLPEETASKFLAALFPAILDGLKQDQSVRISGLGAFKLVRVAPRKSVDISTGESILLDGYSKLTFLPESYIREQINEPYAGLEAVRVDENGHPLDPQSTLPGIDPRVRFGEQADEIKGILADLGQVTEEPKVPEPQIDETPEIPEQPELPENPENPEEPSQEPIKEPAQEPQAPVKEPAKAPKPFRGWVVAVITIAVLLVMLVVGYFVLVNKLEDWADSLGRKAQTEAVIPDEEAEMLEMELLQPMDSASIDSTTAESVDNDNLNDNVNDNLTADEEADFQPTLLAIETVQSGSRLAQISRKYYGTPDYWEYIYEANKDVIDDPNHLRSGTKLKIPKLPENGQ